MPLNITPPKFTYPLISVVIPLFNAEKYVGACLDSLLAQTFQNFEVIVADDCSTDNSVAVVQSYAEKFGGRLKLAHMKKNTGSAGFPRNKGIELSRGEYFFSWTATTSSRRPRLKNFIRKQKILTRTLFTAKNFSRFPTKF